ncbi:hypothetical protein CTE05_02400 [Cellulomonas terrae]|uniref:Major facilitator superfamily (MFS) profile domain-containing protein n=1 Tax=Cellulomonas terrae TaxID=311234 RepID=A0A511JG46_9CELL|nr:hypothetical protein CTE05_02400 [Cellulomonas terrae]
MDSVGAGFFIAGSIVFFTRGLGLDAASVGIGFAIANLVGFLFTVPLGMLSDRIGARRMLVVMYVWRAVWMAVLPFTSSFTAFVVVTTLVTIGDCGVIPSLRALVSTAVGAQDRVRTLAFMRSWRNAGSTVGAALTAPLIAFDSRAAYAAIMFLTAASYVVAAGVIARIRAAGDSVDGVPDVVAPAGPVRVRRRWRVEVPTALKDGPYLLLTLTSMVLMAHITLLVVGIPLWISDHTDVPAVWIPVLVVINTTLAVALQVRFASHGESAGAGRRALTLAGLCLAACCVLVAFTAHVPTWAGASLLVLAVIALTGGELWEAAGSWSLSYRYARPEIEGQYMSVFTLAPIAESVIAPIAVTTLVLGADWRGWVGLAVVFAAAGLVARPVVGLLESSLHGRAGAVEVASDPADERPAGEAVGAASSPT